MSASKARFTKSDMNRASDESACDESASEQTLTAVLERLDDGLHDQQTSVGDVLSAFQDRGFGALVTIIGLIAAAPIVGAIPGMSIITGTLLVLVAVQFLFGRSHPWAPKFLTDRNISTDKLATAVKKVRPYTQWADRYIQSRYSFIVRGVVQKRIIALAIIVLALTMIPLAIVPWGVQLPATAIVLFGIALIGRDGVFGALGYALLGTTFYLIYIYRDVLTSAVNTASQILQ
ncbi:MAG: exopolysaccharide biosynthesis protein [Pseudomonadota bacterium]